jgi:hypothetical protein
MRQQVFSVIEMQEVFAFFNDGFLRRLDHMLIAQQDLLHKADEIRIKLINDAARSRPLKRDEQLTVGQLVLVPWNDKNKRPARFAANYMGPYVVVRVEKASGTVALAHSLVPTPPFEPTTYASAITELRLYDDSLAIFDYDVPDDRGFRCFPSHCPT